MLISRTSSINSAVTTTSKQPIDLVQISNDRMRIPYFNNIPLELLELTASHLDSRDDIIALALTCRKCKQATIPRYSEYRIIRCHYRRSDVWEHLHIRPDLAKNVRKLTVLCDGPSVTERVPSTFLEGQHPDADVWLSSGERLQLVARAVHRMTSLDNFAWFADLEFEAQDEQEAEEDIWRALGRCKHLEHLHFSEPFNYRLLYTQDTYTRSTHPVSCRSIPLGFVRPFLSDMVNDEP